jgi:hypothetical protein
MEELENLACSHGQEPELFGILCSTLQAKASSFFCMAPDQLPSNLSKEGIQLAVNGVKAGTPVLAVLLMCPNKTACCADR